MGKSLDVLLATYNGESYIEDQIRSLENQSKKDFNILVSDDSSTDATLNVVEQLAEIYANIKIVPNTKKFGGAKLNFLHLANVTQADYASFCDQDDVWMPMKLEKTYAKMQDLEAQYGTEVPLLVFSDMKVVDSNLQIIHESFEQYSHIDPTRISFRHVLAQSIGAGCTMMVNRPLLDLLKETPRAEFMIMHDWWISLIAAGFGAIGHVDEPLSLYRQHIDNSVGAEKFSVVQKAAAPKEMTRKFVLTVKQACSFQNVYGKKLDTNKQKTLSQFVSISQSNPVFRLVALCKSNAWKSGLRKVGQVYSALRYKDCMNSL